MAFDPPIRTQAKVLEVLSERTYRFELPNGKLTLGHLPNRLTLLHPEIVPGAVVEVEMTPYDFEKARVAQLIRRADEKNPAPGVSEEVSE